MFDESSGQVFKEWTLPRHTIALKGSGLDWDRRRPYPLFTPRGSRGPRSLVDMAITVIANNIGDVAEGYFDTIPQRLQWRIWRFLEARGICLHAWKVFSHLLLREDEEKTLGLYRFRQHICRPTEDLKRYTQPMTSLTTDFITHLVISGGCDFTANEMLCLAEVKNLGVLELLQPAGEVFAVFPQVNDRLLRGWTEMDNPFPLLRILRVWGDRFTTQESLRWVSKFPSLVLYDVLGSRDDWPSPLSHAADGGWEMAEPAQRLEDSLSQYLMLLAPLEEMRYTRPRDLARSVDSDLVSLCSDSRCAVRFVADRQAPPLLDYLTNAAKVNIPAWDPDATSGDASSCHGVAFEPWAFWLYSFIGQLSQDGDLKRHGIQSDTQAVIGPFVLPSKPLACLFLGHSGRGGIASKPSYVSRGLFSTSRYTFTRCGTIGGQRRSNPMPKSKTGTDNVSAERTEPRLRRNKRQRLDDVLQSLSK